jgi:manganese/iron transport system ATP-binding protein
MSEPVLLVDQLTVAYDRQVVVHDMTMQVAAGESVALIGPNGAGKSTFIKAVLGLVPIHGGTIEILGHPSVDARRHVAYVPQHDHLDPQFPITVQQVVMMGRYRSIGWFRRPSRRDRDATIDALTRVGLAERANDSFGTLSGGQRQRVLIARAIAQDAKLLLLDEPFNGVDTTTQDVLLEVLTALRQAGAAVVMATHDLSVAHLACGHACVLNRHLVAFGPIGEALGSDALVQAYGKQTVVLAEGTAMIHAH